MEGCMVLPMTHLRRALFGCGLLAIAIVLVVGCEEGPGKTPKPPPAETHVLNPPTWIHGTWGYCDPSPIEFYWKFSAHNIELRAGATVTDYREQAKSPGVTITEDQRQDSYRFETRGTDGTAIGSNRFVRDGSRLRWTTSTGGTSSTLTICKT